MRTGYLFVLQRTVVEVLGPASLAGYTNQQRSYSQPFWWYRFQESCWQLHVYFTVFREKGKLYQASLTAEYQSSLFSIECSKTNLEWPNPPGTAEKPWSAHNRWTVGLSKPTEVAASTLNILCVVFAFRFPQWLREARYCEHDGGTWQNRGVCWKLGTFTPGHSFSLYKLWSWIQPETTYLPVLLSLFSPFSFLRVLMCPWLAWNSLWRWRWIWDPPAPTSWVLALQACTIHSVYIGL